MITRQHKTTLTDDALMLFDAMWDGDCALWMLQADAYQEMTDLPYCHRLSDAALVTTLTQLAEHGLVRAYLYVYAKTDDKRYYGLTPEGGALWEMERLPDWQDYCYTSEHDGWWSVESASLETAKAYAQWAYEAGWGAPTPSELTVIRKPMYRFLPWRDFRQVYELRGTAQPKTYRLDWDDYQTRRQWWLDLADLLDL